LTLGQVLLFGLRGEGAGRHRTAGRSAGVRTEAFRGGVTSRSSSGPRRRTAPIAWFWLRSGRGWPLVVTARRVGRGSGPGGPAGRVADRWRHRRVGIRTVPRPAWLPGHRGGPVDAGTDGTGPLPRAVRAARRRLPGRGRDRCVGVPGTPRL